MIKMERLSRAWHIQGTEIIMTHSTDEWPWPGRKSEASLEWAEEGAEGGPTENDDIGEVGDQMALV